MRKEKHTATNTKEKRENRIRLWMLMSLILPYILVYFHRVAPAVVIDPLVKEFHLNAGDLGFLAAIYFFVYTVLQIPAGILSDSIGPRKTIATGTLIGAVGSFMFGVATNTPTLFLGRMLVGIGLAFIFIPILKLHATWFEPRRFATLSGLTLLIGNLGGVLASYPLAKISDLTGWRSAFIFTGGAGIIAALISYLVVRDEPKERGVSYPKGYTPPDEKLNIRTATKGMITIMSRPINWIPFFVFGGLYGTLISFQGTWGSIFLQDIYSISPVEASSLILFFAIGLMIGSPLVGWLADHLKATLGIFIIGLFIFTITILLIGIQPITISLFWMKPLLFVAGCSGAVMVLVWQIGKSFNPPSLAGSSTGFTNMGGSLAGFVMPIWSGKVLEWSTSGWLTSYTGVHEVIKNSSGRVVYPAISYQLVFFLFGTGLLFALALLLLLFMNQKRVQPIT